MDPFAPAVAVMVTGLGIENTTGLLVSPAGVTVTLRSPPGAAASMVNVAGLRARLAGVAAPAGLRAGPPTVPVVPFTKLVRVGVKSTIVPIEPLAGTMEVRVGGPLVGGGGSMVAIPETIVNVIPPVVPPGVVRVSCQTPTSASG